VAVLTEQQMLLAIKGAAKMYPNTDYSKQNARDALQAIEDLIEGAIPNIVSAIDAGTSPTVLTGGAKTAIVAQYFRMRAIAEGAL
jgi:hypothetical protein